MTQQSLPRRLLLPGTLLVMFVLTVAPLRFTWWLGWFGDLASVAVAPIREPSYGVARFLQRDRTRSADPEAIAELKAEQDLLIAKVEQLESENRDLSQMLSEFTTGELLRPSDPPMRQYAAITGRTGDASSLSLVARAGSRKGVHVGQVAVIGGAQIVGKVEDVSVLECQIRPITDKNSSGISGVIRTVEGRYVDCFLKPTGDGTLEGPVAVEDPASVMGAVVRLNDDSWPAFVQRYEIGTVKSASVREDYALSIFVTVRPKVQDLSLLSDVFILLPTGGDG